MLDNELKNQVNNKAEMLEEQEAFVEVQGEEEEDSIPPSNTKPNARFKGSKRPYPFPKRGLI